MHSTLAFVKRLTNRFPSKSTTTVGGDCGFEPLVSAIGVKPWAPIGTVVEESGETFL